MTKTVLAFSILVLFIAITVWFVIQKTKGAGELQKIPIPTPTPTALLTPEASAPIQHESGLITQDLVVGNGQEAKNGNTLRVDYVGTLTDGTKFDSSYDRGQPIEFVLGAGQLIKGWELGLVGMKEGGKRKLIIPPELGYGAKGAGGVIPPNTTLFFEVELVSVTKK